MKCDHLIGRTFNGEVYVLASEAIESIAELKEKLMPCLNGDCILTCEVVEKYGKENAELKQKLQDEHDFGLHIARCADHDDEKRYAEIAQLQAMLEERNREVGELKAKLENVQASMYADVVDANMDNRRLKRALYKVCDNWAVCEMDYWRKCLEHYEDYFNVRTDEDLTEEKCERMIDNWRKVAHNCRAKAEEYK